MNIHVLCDDRARQGYTAEHGLSLFLELNKASLLFDVGQSDVFINNAKKMDLPLKTIDAAIISHGHYDHMGGGRYADSFDRDIYMHADALKEKYSYDASLDRYLFRGVLRSSLTESFNNHLILIEGDKEILEDVWLLTTEGVIHNSRFYVKKGNAMVLDDFHDEVFLVVREQQKLHVVLGCCHIGLKTVINKINTVFPDGDIASVTGGLHLGNESDSSIRSLFEQMKGHGIDRIHPLHCSGERAGHIAGDVFGPKSESPQAGDCFIP